MKLFRNKWFVIVVLLVLVGVVAAFTLNRKPKQEYYTAKVERGDIREVVEATGTINAVTTVQVGSQVSGTISEINVDFNSKVKRGQVIARIDPTIVEGQLLQSRADLENARANLAAARANLERAVATAEQARSDYERTARLAKEGVMSQQQLDLAKATSDSAAAAVSAARAQVTQAQAQVRQREANVAVAETNLKHSIITAPINGTVINRAVDVGQTVAASFQAPTLFTIAQDLTKMQVYAKTDEADVGQIRSGQTVTFKVDAFPRETFRGKVVQVRMNPTTVQNVTTYDSVIEFENPEMKLYPGMTAYITIPVTEVRDVVKVPNGAIRYKPELKPEELKALMDKYGMGGDERRARQSDEQRQAQTDARDRRGSDGEDAGPVKERREVPTDEATVWKLRVDKTLEPVRIRTGVTDHTVSQLVQVIKGELKEGEELVVGSATTRRATGQSAPGMGMGGRPGGGGRR